METKNIINIPEGFKIDKEQSTERQIVLKSISCRPRTWEEYCEKMKGKDSYFCFDHIIRPETFGSAPLLTEFADKEDLEVFIAYSKLLKFRKDWIGDWKPDWTSDDIKFTIITDKNNIVKFINKNVSRPMSFPTKEMRDEFFNCFKYYLEQAKSLL